MNDRYIVTRSGCRVTTKAGLPNIRDVITSHCRTPMFSGQTDLPYTVAHHCLSAAMIAQESDAVQTARFVLLHEVETAVYGDIPGPVKCEQQRVLERDFRDRFFESVGLILDPETWHYVEFYDKIEQAASVTFLGLKETVHQSIWESASQQMKDRALRITQQNYEAFPPKDQLEVGSRLWKAFLFKYMELIG